MNEYGEHSDLPGPTSAAGDIGKKTKMRKMRRPFLFFRILYALVVAAVSALLLVVNLRLYGSPELTVPEGGTPIEEDLAAGLRYLESEMDKGMAAEMQRSYPEGFVFANAMYGLAWCRVAAAAGSDSLLFRHAVREARRAYREIDSEAGKRVFDPSLDLPYGVFYNGWRNLLLAEIVALRRGASPAEEGLFTARCDEIARAFNRSGTPFLQSYAGQVWPADAVVAVASLARHDQIFSPRYTNVLERWRMLVRRRLDPATGLVPHSVDPVDGRPLEGGRGSSQSLMLCFLPLIDPVGGAEQYAIYRRLFFTDRLGVPGVREYPRGAEGEGDIDSGPVLFGVGGAASVVAVGAMRANGDSCRALEQLRGIDALGFPWRSGAERRYFFGYFPIGDAFLAWGRSVPVGQRKTASDPGEELCGCGVMRKLPLHAVSLLAVLLMLLPMIRRSRC